MKKLKLGDKRIHKDDFEQVEECSKCDVLFWAEGEYEMGNWQDECVSCRAKEEEKRRKRKQDIMTNGREVKRNERIFAWILGDQIIFNDKWEVRTTKRVFKTNTTNMDDVIRELRIKGAKTITWHPYLFDSLLVFMMANGLVTGIEQPVSFMTVEHFEGEDGDYEYKINEK